MPCQRRIALGLICLTLCCLLAGCSRGGKDLPLDESLARTSLTSALDGWKKGEKIETLKNRSPAITMGDFEWTAGKQLVDYKLREPTKSDGSNLHCTVELTLKGGDGEARQVVTYIVGTSPVVTIFRD